MSRYDFTSMPGVAVTDILLDVHNPRIRAGHDQADCVHRILRKEAQIIALAEDIAQNGLTTVPILVSPGPTEGLYVVRDGNRRVTALKLLNEPARWSPDARLRARFEAIRAGAVVPVPANVDVLFSANEAAIIREVQMRHGGAMEGVGQLDWSAFLRTVFQVANGLPADYKRPGQYAFWAEDHDIEVPDEFPISSLQRFFSVENLGRLGFTIDGADNLAPNLREDVLKRMVHTVINDFASSTVKVADVFSPEDAARYITRVRAMHGLSEPAPSPAPTPTPAPSSSPAPGGGPPAAPSPGAGGSPPPSPAPAPTQRPPATPAQPPANRKKIFGTAAPGIGIPAGHKAATVVTELRKLNLDETPFAAALLLRVLIELSDEYYRDQNGLPDLGKLAKNIRKSAAHMRDRGMLDRAQFDITDRLCGGGDQSLIEIESLQKMVHRDTHHLTKQFVNTFWDNVAPFVRNCWR